MIILRQKQYGLISEIIRVERNAKKHENKIKSYVDSRASLSQEEIEKVSSELPREYSKLYDIYKNTISKSGRDYCGFWVSDIKNIAIKRKGGDDKPVIIGFFESCNPEVCYDFNRKTWIDEDGKRLTIGQLKKYLIDCCNEDLDSLDDVEDIKYVKALINKIRNI
jgi:hypothetical protein